MGNKNFYKYAHAYDIAFSDRRFKDECDFLEWCLINKSKLSKKKLKEKSFLELGCGPAQHAREFARRNWRSIALDISEDMIEYAKSEAKNENIDMHTIVADMCKYKLKKPVLLTATLMESISHLVTNEQMISHFKSAAKNIEPGGIYVIEATHPMFFFPDDEENTWTTNYGDTSVDITFGAPDDIYNTVTQQWLITSKLQIREGNKVVSVTETKSPIRWYLAEEMKALIELSCVFDKYWFYGSMYNIPPKPLDESEESDAMVIVMRTKK
ncbi:MAG: class I SAM-dependent methyltransferase [Bacteroidetes bacterium]|nr:class I SAM-dependent methyltransferase [Bacteroidota bacterium]MBU1677724.1 class I SAM-dependent methyltransferase [Bacteroidota bacterium]MBU2508401.1 class I SAM-dependent methyltransferase [Bacteroidota bacterium]